CSGRSSFPRQVGRMHLAVEGQHVMLGEAEELEVAHRHYLVKFYVVQRALEDLADIPSAIPPKPRKRRIAFSPPVAGQRFSRWGPFSTGAQSRRSWSGRQGARNVIDLEITLKTLPTSTTAKAALIRV